MVVVVRAVRGKCTLYGNWQGNPVGSVCTSLRNGSLESSLTGRKMLTPRGRVWTVEERRELEQRRKEGADVAGELASQWHSVGDLDSASTSNTTVR